MSAMDTAGVEARTGDKVVWILNHYALGPSAPGGTRHYWLARHLSRLGWRPYVIAASTTAGHRLPRGVHWRLESVAGVPFLWLRTPPYVGSGMGRVRNMLTYAVNAQAASIGSVLPTPSVVVGSSVHPLAAWAASRIASRHGCRFVFEIRDLWPETLIAFGRIGERSVSARLLRRLEGYLCRRACYLVSPLPGAAEYFRRYQVPIERVAWIPNGVNVRHFPYTEMRRRGNRLRLMYFGAHGEANCLEGILRAMALVERRLPRADSPLLRLIGSGPRKLALQNLARQLCLANVSFEDPVANEAIPALAAEADAFVISVARRPRIYRYGVSMNKLYDYLAAARPIVIAIEALNNPVAEAGAGLTVAPEDDEALAAGIIQLARMPYESLAAIGIKGREYVRRFNDYPRLAERFSRVLDACLEAAGPGPL